MNAILRTIELSDRIDVSLSHEFINRVVEPLRKPYHLQDSLPPTA